MAVILHDPDESIVQVLVICGVNKSTLRDAIKEWEI